MKKIISMILCLMLVLSLATTAFATEVPAATSITVPNDGHTYQVYQIFTGDLAGKVLSNIVWGQNGINYVADAKTPVDADTLAALEAVIDASNVDKLEVINDYVNFESEPVATLPNGENMSVEVAPGYYLIKDQDGSVEGWDAYTTYIVEIVGNVTIAPKSSVPEVDKVILDYDKEVKVNEAAIGEDVNYKITGTLPANLSDYKEYYYKFTDTLSKGLTYNGDMTVYVVNGNDEPIDVTDYFYKNATAYDAEEGTTITVAIGDILALNNVGITVNKDTKIVLEYSAVVNEDAVINGANPNVVDLIYSNDPNHSGEGTPDGDTPPPPPEYPPENPGEEPGTDNPTGKTPESKVETYVTEVHIEKVDGDLKALEGASFEITGTAVKTVIVTSETFTKDENGTYWKLTDGTFTTDDPATEGMDLSKYESTTDKYICTPVENTITTTETVKVTGAVGTDGKLTFTGLAAGDDYVIKEIVTPAGYNSIGNINLKIEFDSENKEFTYTWSGDGTGNGDTVTVVNQAGSTLPETGGIGTTLFYVFGGIMVLAAVVLLVTKKRMVA